ncbi:transcriptional regulator with XRE-family HTH domain [Staphylococcus auricularis]|uniref:helix-turn-helix domain-containing protein n=1 Tax=Staphylococcus auricularis TaxID=29379 RepID=UPI0019345660|nr:XRE family transcriptional regulator [Staphylococcus auricularis]MBM0867585.1 XRE family transcriptional regulator [Staphylococcus auricularis]MCG7340451.1 XRE family transcriptional regulator [Staphylococcus auricularis]
MALDIGNRLRNLRRIKDLTQEELAERTDLSKGYISQIESDHASPSMETLLLILEVLGTTPSEFFSVKDEAKILYPKASQTTYDEYDEGYVLNWLVSQSNEFEMEPLLLTLRPQSAYKQFKPSNSETFIYCLEGQVRLVLGSQVYDANEGDALYFKADQRHHLSNPTSAPTRVLIVATSSYL